MGTPPSAHARVLVIDQTAEFRLTIQRYLCLDEVELLEAANGREGMEVALDAQPDLILMDIHAPVWDGFETIKRLKEDSRTASIPVILLSSTDVTSAKTRGLDLGAIDVFVKTVDPEELRARVRAALRAKRLNDTLERRAHLDGLTGLANRHALEERLNADWNLARRHATPLAILIADLDRFKLVNDRGGHQAGDHLLQATAMALRESVRGGDFLARYGGDEFIVVAHDCGLGGALALGERFRSAIANIPPSPGREGVLVTVSVGAAVSDDAGETPGEILGRADGALYHAKSAGRDCVWASDGKTFRTTARAGGGEVTAPRLLSGSARG